MMKDETLGNISGNIHGTYSDRGRAFLLIFFCLSASDSYGPLWPLDCGDAGPSGDRILEDKISLPKRFGSALIIIAVIAGLIALISFIFSQLAAQIVGFAANLPDLRETVQTQLMNLKEQAVHLLDSLPYGMGVKFDTMLGSTDKVLDKAVSAIGNYGMEHSGNVAKGMTSGFIGTIVMFFASYLFIVDKDKIVQGMKSMSRGWSVTRSASSTTIHWEFWQVTAGPR